MVIRQDFIFNHYIINQDNHQILFYAILSIYSYKQNYFYYYYSYLEPYIFHKDIYSFAKNLEKHQMERIYKYNQ
jgi:hypothetical protein